MATRAHRRPRLCLCREDMLNSTLATRSGAGVAKVTWWDGGTGCMADTAQRVGCWIGCGRSVENDGDDGMVGICGLLFLLLSFFSFHHVVVLYRVGCKGPLSFFSFPFLAVAPLVCGGVLLLLSSLFFPSLFIPFSVALFFFLFFFFLSFFHVAIPYHRITIITVKCVSRRRWIPRSSQSSSRSSSSRLFLSLSLNPLISFSLLPPSTPSNSPLVPLPPPSLVVVV